MKKLQCAKEAIEAHGNTNKIEIWYKKWMPKHYKNWGLQTTVQYSLSCLFMEDAITLINKGGEGKNRKSLKHTHVGPNDDCATCGESWRNIDVHISFKGA